MTQRSIAIIVGSLRAGSLNRKVGKAIEKLAPPSLRFAEIGIGDLPLYNQDLDGDPPAQWTAFRDAIRPADGLLFVTPEYNRSIPGVLKNAIDIGSRPYGKSVWTKPAAVISASPGTYGGFGANHALRQSCVFLDVPVMPQPEAYLAAIKDEMFNADGNRRREDAEAAWSASYGPTPIGSKSSAPPAWSERPGRARRRRHGVECGLSCVGPAISRRHAGSRFALRPLSGSPRRGCSARLVEAGGAAPRRAPRNSPTAGGRPAASALQLPRRRSRRAEMRRRPLRHRLGAQPDRAGGADQ